MSRRKSRILAFQGLYSIEVGNNTIEDVLKFDWNNNQNESVQESELADSEKSDANPSENITYARMLVSGTMEHLAEIDEIIKKHLKSWDISRVNKVSLSILRMSVYSLKYQKDLLPSIVIDEAIHLAKSFGPSDSFKFVNAILDNIKKYINTTNESKK
ncbi:MAG: transcription antitermination factor NusB [Treponema sp.]|nr:transcription antitermination factor NusB [Treponema sp.]